MAVTARGFGGVLASGGLWEFLSSKSAMGIYVAVLLVLVAVLAVNVIVSLSLVKKHGGFVDELASTKKKKKVIMPDRFSVLKQIDEEYADYTAPVYERERSLSRICEDFRSFAASELGLYYSIDDIRRFVAGLGVTRLIILQGMSGTGKTSLAYAFGQYIDNDSVVVPVQPMWKERSDIIGYFNEFTKKFNETTLLRKMYEAGYKREMYITVLDEMNISRIEYYFAEFLSLLELPDEEKRYLDVVSDVWSSDPKCLVGGKVKLPPNMWFVGTANNDDSTFAISDKVYDRAMVLNLEKKCEPFTAPSTGAVKISYERFCELVREAQSTYALSEKQEENIRRFDAYLVEKFRISFGNRIMKQIREYVPVHMACGGSEVSALDDIFARKVLRKLEAQSPSYVKGEMEGLLAALDATFDLDDLPQCRAYLQHLSETMA